MSVKRWLFTIFACSGLLACGSGGRPAPEPVGSQDPLPASQEPQPASQNPKPDPQTPPVPSEEPLPNAQDPGPPVGGEAGASPGDS